MHVVKNVLYFLLAVFCGGVMVAVSLFAYQFGFQGLASVRPFVILSGSMEPVVPVGSIVFAKPEPVYFPGNIITFSQGKQVGDMVTHRIVAAKDSGTFGAAEFTTKGDANKTPDAGTVPAAQVYGKVFAIVPYTGYFVSFAKTPQGFILLVIIPATILIWEEIKSAIAEFRKLNRRKKETVGEVPESGTGALRIPLGWQVAIVLVATVAVTGAAAGVRSYFSDRENSPGTLGISTAYDNPAVTPTPTPSVPEGFRFRTPVAIDNMMVQGGAVLTDFPVLIYDRLDGYDGKPDLRHFSAGGHVRSLRGYDIQVFADQDLTGRLDHELQSYNPDDGTLIIWVRIPVLDPASDTTVYLAYGDGGIHTDSSTATTWPTHYQGVWHFNEASGTFADSTVQHRDSTGAENVAYAQPGPFGLSVGFNNSGYIKGADSGLAAGSSDRTITAWVKPVSPADYDVIFGYGVSAPNQMCWYSMLSAGSLMFTQYGGGFNTGSYVISDGQWHYVSLRALGNSWEIIGDGASRGQTNLTAGTVLNGEWSIGNNLTEANRYFNGYIAEVRFSNQALSDGWLATEYANQSAPEAYIIFGSEEAL